MRRRSAGPADVQGLPALELAGNATDHLLGRRGHIRLRQERPYILPDRLAGGWKQLELSGGAGELAANDGEEVPEGGRHRRGPWRHGHGPTGLAGPREAGGRNGDPAYDLRGWE